MSDIREVLPSAVVVAPMAAGPSTPGLVLATAAAGTLGFLASGYKTAAQMRAEIDIVRSESAAPFGVNVFVPGRPAADADAVASYIAGLEAEGFAVDRPAWDDDDWDAKVDVLLDRVPPVVTFTFGVPPRTLVDALHERGSSVGVTVTSAYEAGLAQDAGASFLCVQGPEAGAHRGTFVNEGPPADRPLGLLLEDVVGSVPLPVLAAGGVATKEQVKHLVRGSVVGVLCGTAFLRCPESGAKQPHKDALADPRFTETAVTRAFSGRPARGLRNRFMNEHGDAPAAYPEINNATRPLRAVGDPDAMSLWAGTGWRHAEERPVADVLDQLLR